MSTTPPGSPQADASRVGAEAADAAFGARPLRAVLRRELYNEERESGLPRLLLRGTRNSPATCCARASTAGSRQAGQPFLILTLWIAMFERDHPEPLAMQLGYAARLSHVRQPYPDIST
jgi:hypothetical protein